MKTKKLCKRCRRPIRTFEAEIRHRLEIVYRVPIRTRRADVFAIVNRLIDAGRLDGRIRIKLGRGGSVVWLGDPTLNVRQT